MPRDENRPKLCLSCARQKLAGKTPRPCGDCVLLNVDPLAQVRANAALPSPLARFSMVEPFPSPDYGPNLKPARATRGGAGS